MRQGAPTQAGQIPPAAWTAMNEAARRAGLPLDEWLHQRLLGPLGGGERGAAVGDIADLRRRIRELTGTMNHLAASQASEQAALTQAATAPASPTTSRVEAALDDIRSQLDTLVGDSGARLRTTAPLASPQHDTQAPSAASIEAAVAEIAARQRELDVAAPPAPGAGRSTPARPAPGRAAITSSASVPAASAAQATTPVPAAPSVELRAPSRPATSRTASPSPATSTAIPPGAPHVAAAAPTPLALDTLRGEVAQLRAALGDLAPRQAVDELQRTVTRLAARVEASGLRDKELCATLTALRDMIAALRLPEYQAVTQGRIDALSRKLDLIAAKQVDGAAIARLQAQAGEIRAVIGRALSNDTVRQLVEQVTLLVGRVSREAGSQENALRAALAGIDERLGQLAARIEAQAARPVEVDLGGVHRRLDDLQENISANFSSLRNQAPAGVEQLLRGLGERLERIERPVPPEAPAPIPVPDTGAFETLSRQIATLADRLEAQHAQPNRLAGIERALNDLFIQMEETRASLVSVPPPRPPVDPAPRGGEPPRPPESAALAPTALVSGSPAAAPAASADSTARLADMAIAATSPAVEAPMPPPVEAAVKAPAALPANDRAPEASEPDSAEVSGAGPARIDFIAQARRAARGAPATVPHVAPSRSARIAEGRASRARSTRWLARIRAMLLVGVCGSALAFASWHLLSGMKEGRLRASAPAATSTARSLPFEPTPDDITGSVSPRPAPPAFAPEAPAAPTLPIPALPESTPARPAAPLPGSSSLDLPPVPGDLPNGIGGQGLRVAALAGDADAAYEVGHRYTEGDGVAPSTARAAQWFAVAAAHGSIPAAYRLGALYEKGADGVPRDLPRARALYEAAAAGGNVRAMHNLGVMLADGSAGAPDYAGAAVWFQKAAGYGVRDSQYNLGVLYARGFGVAADQLQAWRWFALAAARGDQEAAARRDEIAARLDTDTLASARKALQLWAPAEIDARANSGSGLTDLDVPAARKTASRG
ncbi:SEL1-like repeat protein [Ancylobacter sonchi]|uniref:SEL1-like repeat protein n=1 Tax=Ancylobacter sonchi TaxID=1937790 RepID=UPI001BD233D6|nr:SEL1-like repeat protein [Ancylobacter sonchi]MBS7536910.1 SEL1-like repeat protein [Ancylobacter sonchi]